MNVDAVAAAQVHKAIAGDTAAFVAIRDTVDRKPQSSESNRGPPSIAINIVSADKVAIAINE